LLINHCLGVGQGIIPMECTHCHTVLPDNSKFCLNCGKPVLISEKLVADEKDGLWGYVDENGSIIIAHSYYSAKDFEDGVAEVSTSSEEYGYINEQGILITPTVDVQYEEMGNFSEGLVYIGCWRDKSNYRYYNKKGEIVIEGDFHSATDFIKGRAIVSYGGERAEDDWLNQKWAIINKAGEIVKELDYTHVYQFKDGLARVNRGARYYDMSDAETYSFWSGGKYGYINEQGEEVIPIQFEGARDFSEGYAAVNLGDNSWCFIGKTGKRISGFYEDAGKDSYLQDGFKDGLALVFNRRKWGCVDYNMREIIDLVYDDIEFLSNCEFNSFLKARIGEKWGIITRNGYEITDFIYDQIYYVEEYLFIAQKNGKYGVLNEQGKILSDFVDGEFEMMMDKIKKLNTNQ